MKNINHQLFSLVVLALLEFGMTSCADKSNTTVQCIQDCHQYGFFGGYFHAMISGFDFIGSLIWPNSITVYAQNNNGNWYAFGFVLGIGTLIPALKLLLSIILRPFRGFFIRRAFTSFNSHRR